MPKRIQKLDMVNADKILKKSGLINCIAPLSNLEHNEEKNEVPVEKPKEHMQYMKSNKDNEIERLFLHNSKLLMRLVDHSDLPAFNVGVRPQESVDMNTYYPSCAFSSPRPMFVANKHSEKIDICYKRPMNREFHQNRMKHSRAAYQAALKGNKNIRSSIKDEIYHSSVFDIAEREYMQPDPYFHSNYDYYFTGGNLSVSKHQGSIIHAGGKNMQKILVSDFPVTDGCQDNDRLDQMGCLEMSENCEIFEIQPLLTSVGHSHKNVFVSRQRNLITINNINENNEIKTMTQFRTKSTPFISFAQSERDINKFVVTTMKQHVRLYDLNERAPALVKLFEISPNTSKISWNSVKPWREHTFMYANEKQFFMIDVRTSPNQWLNDITFATDTLICDRISAILPSGLNNLFYVATNHKLKCMDVRQLKYSLSNPNGAICGWTHQLRFAPLMMDTFRIRHTEVIALSSPIATDLHICQLSRERNEDNIKLKSTLHEPKHIYSSRCLPYQPPTLLEAYENARLSGKCLRPEANLESRLKCCTTGMKFLNLTSTNSECKIGLLLTLNSNGDVFAHTLSKREEEEVEDRYNAQSDEIMAEFEHKICKQAQVPLNYTDIKNMKGLRKVFLCKTLSSINKFDFDAMDNEYDDDAIVDKSATNPLEKSRPKRLHLGRWQKSFSTLHSYKDALVADLLSIWDIDIEEEKNIHLGNLSHNDKADPAVKVEDWLEQNICPNIPPMLSIPPHVMSTYCENDTIDFENVVHSTQITENNVSGILAETTHDTLNDTVEKLRNKRKNKKYIKGF